MRSLLAVALALTVAPAPLFGSHLAVPLKVDRYGDPLPRLPIVRLGTIRSGEVDGSSCLAFSRDGKTLATGQSGSIHLWDVRSGALLRQYQIPQPKPGFGTPHVSWHVGAITFDEQNRLFAAISSPGAVVIRDVNAGKEIRRLSLPKGNYEWMFASALSADGKVLACKNASLTAVSLWDVPSAKKIRDIDLPEGLEPGIAFSPDGKIVAIALSGKADWIYLWEVKTGKSLGRISLRSASAYSITFSPDGKMLAVTYGYPFRYFDVSPLPKIDTSVSLLDLATGREVRTMLKNAPDRSEIVFSPDGKTLAISGRMALILLDANTGRELRGRSGHLGPVYSVGFSADGKTLISIGCDSTIRLWEVAAGRQLRKLNIAEHSFHVALSREGKLAAIVSNDGVDLWDTTEAKRLWECKVTEGRQNFALSPDGKLLATVEGEPQYSDRLQVWDTSNHRRVQQWNIDPPLFHCILG
jgi:WD40 repeat protein